MTFLCLCLTAALCLLHCCISLSLCALPSHSAAVRAFSLVFSPLPFSFVSAPVSVLAFSSFFPFALLLLPVSLALNLSLCRCPCLFAGFQSLAVFFCLSSCPCPGFFLFLSFCLCCFSLSLCALPSHSAAVRAFSLASSSLPFSFVSFLSFLPFFASFFCPFCFHKSLTSSTFARTPSEPHPTSSYPAHCCRYVTTA